MILSLHMASSEVMSPPGTIRAKGAGTSSNACDVDLVAEQRVVGGILHRASGVDGESVAPDQRDPLLDKVLGCIAAKARPVLEEHPSVWPSRPSVIPTVAEEYLSPWLDGTMLLLPASDVISPQGAAQFEACGFNGSGSADQPVQGYLVYTVVSGAFGDEMERSIHVGPGVLAHRQAVVAGDVPEFVGFVEGLTEASVGRPGWYAFLQRVA